jgi:L-amino acid N-acyltransferase YncA
MVRPSLASDIAAIAAIYGYHVQNGTASFEIDPPDEAEMARRRSGVLERGLPYLTAEMDGEIAGYAYASPYRPRAAYRFTLEDSIYIHPAHIGKGIGSRLLPKLITACEETPAKQMVAIIGDINNSASVRLHERFGFTHVGVLHAVGFKFERWVDTILMQRALGSSPG